MNLFAYSSLLIVFTNLSMVVVVIWKGKRNKISNVWVCMCLAVSVWGLGGYKFSTTSIESDARFWWQIADIGAILMPPFYLHFVFSFLNLSKRLFLAITYFLAGIFIFFDIFLPKYFLGAVTYKFNQFYWADLTKNQSLLYVFVYVSFFVVLIAYAFLYLLKNYKNVTGVKKTQLKYFIFASVFGWLGSELDFLPKFGFNLYPFSNFLIALYPLIIGYAILKHRLMDISIAITRTGIFIVVYTLALGIPFGLASLYRDYLIHTFGLNWMFIPSVLVALLASAAPIIFLTLSRRTEALLRAEERHVHDLLKQAAEGMLRFHDASKLAVFIAHLTSKMLKLDNSGVYLLDGSNNAFMLAAVRYKSKDHYAKTLTCDKLLIAKLSAIKEPLVYEEIKREADDKKSILVDPVHAIEAQMKALRAAVAVPAVSDGRLLGILILGEKKTKRMYTTEDLSTLLALSCQAALAIENASLYEKEKGWLVEKSKRQALADMAPGASHQFNNRLISISSCAENLKDILQYNSQKLSKEEIISTVSQEMEFITSEALKGAQITRAILQKAKVKLTFEKVDIVKIINNAINLAELRQAKDGLESAQDPELNFTYQPDLPLITLCEGPIQDVFENILSNSFDAVVTKRSQTQPENYQGKIAINVLKKNDNLIVTIEDNGIGIPEENVSKLFAPYFTTKSTSEKGVLGGLGLGLYVIRDFVERHGGTIAVESSYASWTRVTITFPLNFTPQ